MEVFAAPFVVAGHSFQLGASIGVAVLDEEDLSLEGLLSDADSAMYFAKTGGGQGKIQVFDKAIRAMARERTTTESDLGYALEHSELVVYYQPIVETGERARRRGRSAPAVAASDPRAAAAGRLSRPGRADRAHRAHRRVGLCRRRARESGSGTSTGGPTSSSP